MADTDDITTKGRATKKRRAAMSVIRLLGQVTKIARRVESPVRIASLAIKPRRDRVVSHRDRTYPDRYRADRSRETSIPRRARQRDDFGAMKRRVRAPSSTIATTATTAPRRGRASAAATGASTRARTRRLPAAAPRITSDPTIACAKRFATA